MRRLLLLLACFGFVIQGFCQVINTEKKRLNQDEDGWAGNIDTGFSLIKNTRDILQFTNKVNVQYLKEKHALLLLNDFSLMSVNKESLLNRGFQHVRYSYETRPYLIPEAFVQAQYNQIWNIDLRFLVGAGPRFRILRTDTSHIYMGTLVMYEYEQIANGSEYNRDVRLSTYLSGRYSFSPWVSVESITYFQPKVNDFADFRVSTESSLRFALTTRLGFHTTLSLSYDSRPPDDLQPTFYSWINGLTFNF